MAARRYGRHAKTTPAQLRLCDVQLQLPGVDWHTLVGLVKEVGPTVGVEPAPEELENRRIFSEAPEGEKGV